MLDFLKLYGERHTGTNYFSKLIDLNLNIIQLPGVVDNSKLEILKNDIKLQDIESIRDSYFELTLRENLGWKHSRPPISLINDLLKDHKIIFITLSKNPYSWLLSLYRKPYHQYYEKKLSFEEFLCSPWNTVGRDDTLSPINDLNNPIELWNIKNHSYMRLDKNLSIHFNYEDLLNNPAKILDNISNKFNIQKKENYFINIEMSTKDKNKDYLFYKDYYLNEKWKTLLSKKAISIINDQIDKDLMDIYGYEIIKI